MSTNTRERYCNPATSPSNTVTFPYSKLFAHHEALTRLYLRLNRSIDQELRFEGRADPQDMIEREHVEEDRKVMKDMLMIANQKSGLTPEVREQRLARLAQNLHYRIGSL